MRMAGVRLPDELLESIAKLATQTHRSKTFIVTKAVETYLRDEAEYQIALDRLGDKDDEIISSVKMRGKLEKANLL